VPFDGILIDELPAVELPCDEFEFAAGELSVFTPLYEELLADVLEGAVLVAFDGVLEFTVSLVAFVVSSPPTTPSVALVEFSRELVRLARASGLLRRSFSWASVKLEKSGIVGTLISVGGVVVLVYKLMAPSPVVTLLDVFWFPLGVVGASFSEAIEELVEGCVGGSFTLELLVEITGSLGLFIFAFELFVAEELPEELLGTGVTSTKDIEPESVRFPSLKLATGITGT